MSRVSNSRLRLRALFQPLVNLIAVILIRFKLTPNMVTVFGAVLATFTPFLMMNGEYVLFGVVVFFVGLMDGVDGAIARITKKVTKWGGFLDSLLDRYGDSIIFISYLFNSVSAPLGSMAILSIQVRIWVCIAIAGSLMVSYTRAKSEATGVKESDVGIAARSARLLILSITGILSMFNEYIMIYGLIITAILANVTAVQRIVHSYRILKKRERGLKH
jgi:phosphatidylglycerophosphate synthase